MAPSQYLFRESHEEEEEDWVEDDVVVEAGVGVGDGGGGCWSGLEGSVGLDDDNDEGLLGSVVGREDDRGDNRGGGGGGGAGMMLPVKASTRCSLIHVQFSASISGHSARNRAPSSPAKMAPALAVEPRTDAAVTAAAVAGSPRPGRADPPPVEFHQRDCVARRRRSDSLALMLPRVISSLVMKDSRPIRMVEMPQAGLKDLGWKSLMLRQSRVDG